ncbi:hypothetical protein ABZS61_31495 [Streptomyces sp. NPDC005566]|uniref:hypothetical protein n=1 Tax=Streptomyces sp. NPDC005566 TaxID=3156886 RepID=UPI0033A9FB80
MGWLNGPFYAPEKTDAEIREYCLEQVKAQLTTNISGRHAEDALVRATQFATIAQAFRPDPPTTGVEQ